MKDECPNCGEAECWDDSCRYPCVCGGHGSTYRYTGTANYGIECLGMCGTDVSLPDLYGREAVDVVWYAAQSMMTERSKSLGTPGRWNDE